MKRLSCLLLCAGKGTRAKRFKPLCPWEGETYLEKTYRALKASEAFHEICVVTGFQSDLLAPVLERLGAISTRNPEYEKGMHSSIRKGLLGLEPGWDAVCIAFVDQPQLELEDYRFLAEAYQKSATDLLRPRYQDEIGNPAILGRRYLDEICLEPDTDRGCSYLFSRYPERVSLVDMPNERCLIDFDRGEDGNTALL